MILRSVKGNNSRIDRRLGIVLRQLRIDSTTALPPVENDPNLELVSTTHRTMYVYIALNRNSEMLFDGSNSARQECSCRNR